MRAATVLGTSSLAMMLLASPATSAAPTPTIYLMTMQMHDGDRLVGSPKLKFEAGTPSKVEIGDAAGNLYTISFTVTLKSAETVAIKSTIDLVSAGVHRTVSPTMLVALNKPSAIAFGVESPTSKPFRVDFTINTLS